MKEILLCKYGEIVLKGANRKYFEDMLCKTLRFRARHFGKFLVTRSQSTIIIEPQDDAADIDGMFDSAMKVFGIVGISRCAVCGKDMDRIRETVREYVPQFLDALEDLKKSMLLCGHPDYVAEIHALMDPAQPLKGAETT